MFRHTGWSVVSYGMKLSNVPLCYTFTGQDWRPLDDTETCKSDSRLIKPILTADYDNTQNFCAGISKHAVVS